MYQPQPSDPDPDDDLEQLGRPIYQGDGLQVRGLTEEELARFLAAHAGQPARLVGSGWTNSEPRTTDDHVEPERHLTFQRQLSDSTGPASAVPIPTHSAPLTGSYGTPGASARTIYRRLRVAELADWSCSLAWRLPLVGGAGIGAAILTSPLPSVTRLAASLVVVGAVGWRLRFRASAEASAWRQVPAASGAPRAGCVALSVAATSLSMTLRCRAHVPTSTTC